MDKIIIGTITLIAAATVAISSLLYQPQKEDKPYTIETVEDELSNHLASLLKEDGSFIYYYDIESHDELSGYNMIRHSHSVWALIEYYKSRGVLAQHQDEVKAGIDFIVSHMIFKDDLAYVAEIDSDEIKLGALGIALVAICSYEDSYNDQSYLDIAKGLGNGIISMQKKYGGYYHVFSQYSLKLKDANRTIYYDGEGTLGLLKLYGLTKEQKYLDVAKEEMDFFIRNHYEKQADHWQEYSAWEISKYDDDIKYLEYGIRNLSSGFKEYSSQKYFDNADYEIFRNAKLIYAEYIKRTGKEYYTEDFKYEDINKELTKRKNELVQRFESIRLSEDYNPQTDNIVEKFYLSNGDKTIRIDYLAHFICGLLD